MADKRHYRDTDYLYASAYIRSVEDRGLSDQLVTRMLEAPDAASALSILFEARSALDGGSSIDDADLLCDEFVNDSFRVVAQIVTDPSVFDFMRYQYDCNNIKTALKCRAKGVGTDGLLFSCGTVPPEAYAKMTEDDDFSALPGDFPEAAKTAADTYKKTGDPQSIDLTLDLSCLSSMTKAAGATGEKFLTDAVKLRVDIANVTAVTRVLRMGMTETSRKDLLGRALSPLGSIRATDLISLSDEGEEQFFAGVRGRVPAVFGDKLTTGAPLSEMERAGDNAYLEHVMSAKNTAFGVSVPFLYLTGREYNAKNARIIIAGKRAGLPYDEISRRVRSIRM